MKTKTNNSKIKGKKKKRRKEGETSCIKSRRLWSLDDWLIGESTIHCRWPAVVEPVVVKATPKDESKFAMVAVKSIDTRNTIILPLEIWNMANCHTSGREKKKY